MRIVLTSVALAVILSCGYSVRTQTLPGSLSKTEPMQTRTIVCPWSIGLKIVGAPPEWEPQMAPGGAQLAFQQIVVSTDSGRPTISCFYTNQKTSLALHSLRQVQAANLICSVDTAGTRPRSATCKPRLPRNRP